jgi:hypothetical protein
MIIFYVLLGLVVVRTLALLAFIAVIARPVQACPACFAETLAVRSPWLVTVRRWFEVRWCPRCGWQGVAQKKRRAPAAAESGSAAGTPSRH